MDVIYFKRVAKFQYCFIGALNNTEEVTWNDFLMGVCWD